jgi:CRISPR-associated protein Cmr3
MRYKITLKPLQPYLFSADNTYGSLTDKENSTYLVKSRHFPQQSALLGMLKKEIMIQSGVLSRKIRGEWVDKDKKDEANRLVGTQKFDIASANEQDFGAIKHISPLFLEQNGELYVKKANLRKFPLKKISDNYLLDGFTPKDSILDNYEQVKNSDSKTSSDIFEYIEQTLNQKNLSENSLFKKTSCNLKDGFVFCFYAELDFELRDSIVTLGSDRSSFAMRVERADTKLQIHSEHLLLLSDCLITIPLRGNCDFAISSEISYRNLTAIKGVQKGRQTDKNSFAKSDTIYLCERGSVIINPSGALIDNLNNKNCQKIGYNIYTLGETTI